MRARVTQSGTRDVNVRGLALTTLSPFLVPIRTIITLYSRAVASDRNYVLAVEDITAPSDKKAARVLCLEARVAGEYLKGYAEVWSDEVGAILERVGPGKVSYADIIKVGALLGLDGGRRAAALTLKNKYSTSFRDRDWYVWLSEEVRSYDPGTHVGMLLVNASGVAEQSRIWTAQDSNHMDMVRLTIQLSDLKKQDKKRVLKDLDKHRVIKMKKKDNKTVHIGKKFDTEEAFFAAFREASKKKARTTTL